MGLIGLLGVSRGVVSRFGLILLRTKDEGGWRVEDSVLETRGDNGADGLLELPIGLWLRL